MSSLCVHLFALSVEALQIGFYPSESNGSSTGWGGKCREDRYRIENIWIWKGLSGNDIPLLQEYPSPL